MNPNTKLYLIVLDSIRINKKVLNIHPKDLNRQKIKSNNCYKNKEIFKMILGLSMSRKIDYLLDNDIITTFNNYSFILFIGFKLIKNSDIL